MPLHEWMDQLAAVALLGAERAGDNVARTSGADALDAFLARLPAQPRDVSLLAAAGVAAVYSRAGIVAPAAPEPSRAPPHDVPEVSPASGRHLSLLLAGHYEDVLPEYLDLVAGAGRRVPARHLWNLLRSMHANTHRDKVVAVLGSRGRWLAAQNNTWLEMTALPTLEHYHTGTPGQRRALLTHLRKTDPPQARTLIAGTWAEESPDDRAAFIGLMAVGLSMEDEPFLESALDDKRKEVRTAAATLLASLPDSRLCKRMTERLAPLVKLAGFIKKKIAAQVPETHDAAMARDGIDAKTARHLMGDKAWQLACIIAGTPLKFWTDALNLEPAAIFPMTKGLEWQKAIIAGLSLAALRQRNVPFAQAVLAYWLDGGEFEWHHDHNTLHELTLILPPERREATYGQFIGDKKISEGNYFLDGLGFCRHAWSKSFSESFLSLLWRLVDADRNSFGHQSFKIFCLYVHPSILPAITARLKAEPVNQADHLDKFVSTLQIRHDIHKEF